MAAYLGKDCSAAQGENTGRRKFGNAAGRRRLRFNKPALPSTGARALTGVFRIWFRGWRFARQRNQHENQKQGSPTRSRHRLCPWPGRPSNLRQAANSATAVAASHVEYLWVRQSMWQCAVTQCGGQRGPIHRRWPLPSNVSSPPYRSATILVGFRVSSRACVTADGKSVAH